MIEPFFWIIWSIWMLAAGYAVWNAASYLKIGLAEEACWAEAAGEQRSVAVIVAIKGYDSEQTDAFFEALLTQDYRDYRVILTFESDDDPAAVWVREKLDLRGKEVDLVVAGPCEEHGQGQKVHNQMAAFQKLQSKDEVIVFADADIRMSSDWLARLVVPINAGTHRVSTTYRWLVPEKPGVVNAIASVMNAAVATMGGNDLWNMTWGGSMAIAREDFDELDVPALFAGSMNDDLRLGRYVRQNGRKIAFVRSLLIASPIDHSFGSFVEFVRRQYYQVRHFAPLLYAASFLALWLYPVAFFLAIGALLFMQYLPALIPLVVVVVLDQVRAVYRYRVASQLYEGETLSALARCRWAEHFATPLWITFHAVLAASARMMSRVTWAGITYRVTSPEKTEVFSRQKI